MVSQNSPIRVLIVEDEQGLREILEINLRSAGYRVCSAADGVAAWQLFEQEQPDIVLLDLNLPGLSGFRLLELMRRESALPILVVTAYDFAEAEEVSRFHPSGFVKKPFDLDEVIRQIGVLTGRGAGG